MKSFYRELPKWTSPIKALYRWSWSTKKMDSSTFSVGHPPDRYKTVVRPLLTELEKPNLSRSYKQAGPTGLGLPAIPSGGPAHRQSLRKPRQGRPVCRKLAPKFPMSSVGAACSEAASFLNPSWQGVRGFAGNPFPWVRRRLRRRWNGRHDGACPTIGTQPSWRAPVRSADSFLAWVGWL